MPEVGEYWYQRHGGPEVVRVVAESEMSCTVVVMNALVRPSVGFYDRLLEMDAECFRQTYQDTPDISLAWLESGSAWFDRRNAAHLVHLAEGSDVHTVRFRTLDEGNLGVVEMMRRSDFTARYVRIYGDLDEQLNQERFWVVGSGIRALFVSQWEAQAYVFDTSTLLNLPDGALQIVLENAPVMTPGAAPSGRGGGASLVAPIIDFDQVRLDVQAPTRRGSPTGQGVPVEVEHNTARPTLWDRLTDPSDE
jgi:hypothetical protein